MTELKRILLVDDEEMITRTLTLFLERAGPYRVRAVNDPRRGVEEALDFRPDLMILDIVMPQMDGGELAAKLAEEPSLARVPVIFMTALVKESEIGMQGGEISGRRFLAKPVEPSDLISVIEATLL